MCAVVHAPHLPCLLHGLDHALHLHVLRLVLSLLEVVLSQIFNFLSEAQDEVVEIGHVSTFGV